MSYTVEELSNMYSFKDAVHVVESVLAEIIAERDSYGPEEGTGLYNDWDAYHHVQQSVEAVQDVLTVLASESLLNYHIEEWEKKQETGIPQTAAEQFDSFEIGQEFYPSAGEDATYRFVKTGENSVVQIHQVTGEARVYADALARENFSHWCDYPADLVPITRD